MSMFLHLNVSLLVSVCVFRYMHMFYVGTYIYKYIHMCLCARVYKLFLLRSCIGQRFISGEPEIGLAGEGARPASRKSSLRGPGDLVSRL